MKARQIKETPKPQRAARTSAEEPANPRPCSCRTARGYWQKRIHELCTNTHQLLLSRPPVGWESSPSSAMSPQNRKGNHATTASRRQPRRSLSADEGASIPLHQFRPLSSPACPPTAPRMGQPPQKERGPPAILAGDVAHRALTESTISSSQSLQERQPQRGSRTARSCTDALTKGSTSRL